MQPFVVCMQLMIFVFFLLVILNERREERNVVEERLASFIETGHLADFGRTGLILERDTICEIK